MSIVPNHIATMAAGAAYQAQQTARQQDKKEADAARTARRFRDIVDAHIHQVEEGGPSQPAASQTVDSHQPHDPRVEPKKRRTRAATDHTQPAAPGRVTPDDGCDEPRHVDLTA